MTLVLGIALTECKYSRPLLFGHSFYHYTCKYNVVLLMKWYVYGGRIWLNLTIWDFDKWICSWGGSHYWSGLKVEFSCSAFWYCLIIKTLHNIVPVSCFSVSNRTMGYISPSVTVTVIYLYLYIRTSMVMVWK